MVIIFPFDFTSFKGQIEGGLSKHALGAQRVPDFTKHVSEA
jgi:hypothetical protein